MAKDYERVDVGKAFGQMIDQTVGAIPRLTKAETNAAGQRAGMERAIVNKQGKATINSIFKASPDLKKAKDSLFGQLSGIGPSDIEKELTGQAFADLKLGGALSAEDQRLAQQAARGAFAARGLNNSNVSAVAEVLGRQQYSDERLNNRRAFAGNVEAQNQGREAADRGFASTVYNQGFATLDPYQRVFGAYSQQGGNPATLGQAFSAGGTNVQAGINQNQFAANLQKSREELAAEIEQANLTRKSNMQGAVVGGLLGGFGTALGGWLGK
jgi:hypothetical protein